MKFIIRLYDDSQETFDPTYEGNWYTAHWFEAFINMAVSIIAWSIIWSLTFWMIAYISTPFAKIIKENICVAPLNSNS